MKERTYKRIESIRKGNEILKYLGQMKEPASGPEIAAAVGLPTGTVMCYLATHEDAGFVQRIGDRYQVGLGLVLIKSRLKSNLEGQRMLIDANLKELDSGSSPE